MPQWYLDKPEAIRGDEFYLRAFWELSSCRVFGQVIGPIPWDSTLVYAQHKRLDAEMTEVFSNVIREMDEAYLKFQREQHKKKTTK